MLFVIRAYQILLSPVFGSCCRFYPTCSEYASQCVIRFGAFRGGWLAIKRLAKCHPFHPGGIDPVPETLYPTGTDSCTGIQRPEKMV